MDELRVDLAAFQGPLDLLLHLVQQEEVDIYEIPIARIADRFLEACRGQMQALDVDKAGEFLVMASQLLVLKSRALLPRETELEVEEIDPRLDLVRQLIEYRDFKQLAGELGDRADVQRGKHQVRAVGPDRTVERGEELPLEVDLFALVSAFQRLLRETGEDHFYAAPKERLPITHFVSEIFDHLVAVGGSLGFRELIGAKPDRSYVIGAFLALLELIKLRKIQVKQEGLEDITIALREDAMEEAAGSEEELADVLDHPDLHEEQHVGPRIIFMGSPEFAAPALQSLVGAGFRPRLVVTPPPRRAGRGRRMKQVPVAREAEQLELPLHRTGDVNGRTSRNELEAVKPDVIITAGFGQKLGSGILSLPEKGCINIHASLLPKYRGASPVAAAIRAGEKETGVSIFVMDEKMDHGQVIATTRLPIGDDETTDDVTKRLAEAGADLLVRTLGSFLDGELEPTEQNHEESSYFGRLTKKDGIVDWAQPAAAVRNFVRSMTSWPGAQSAWQPRVKHAPLPVVIVRTELVTAVEPEAPAPPEGEAAPAEAPKPGTVLAVSQEGIDVACETGVLRIVTLRPAGGRVMAVKDFLNSRRVVVGDRFIAPRDDA
ncbi:MAG: methionyl-tRNA formyltransferase [Planctomycetota bacterium]|nr:methionyl-tRNA formyltransferase [Planctomycetota bacterium]